MAVTTYLFLMTMMNLQANLPKFQSTMLTDYQREVFYTLFHPSKLNSSKVILNADWRNFRSYYILRLDYQHNRSIKPIFMRQLMMSNTSTPAVSYPNFSMDSEYSDVKAMSVQPTIPQQGVRFNEP